MTIQGILLFCYCLLLMLAAIQDMVSLKISNAIIIAVFAVAMVSVGLWVQPSLWWEHGASFALVLTGGAFLFRRGWIGGGDAKLFSAAALWFDLNELVFFLALAMAIGGVLALAVLGYRAVGLGARGFRRGKAIPYGVPIAMGAISMAITGAMADARPSNDLMHSRINFVSRGAFNA